MLPTLLSLFPIVVFLGQCQCTKSLRLLKHFDDIWGLFIDKVFKASKSIIHIKSTKIVIVALNFLRSNGLEDSLFSRFAASQLKWQFKCLCYNIVKTLAPKYLHIWGLVESNIVEIILPSIFILRCKIQGIVLLRLQIYEKSYWVVRDPP